MEGHLLFAFKNHAGETGSSWSKTTQGWAREAGEVTAASVGRAPGAAGPLQGPSVPRLTTHGWSICPRGGDRRSHRQEATRVSVAPKSTFSCLILGSASAGLKEGKRDHSAREASGWGTHDMHSAGGSFHSCHHGRAWRPSSETGRQKITFRPGGIGGVP